MSMQAEDRQARQNREVHVMEQRHRDHIVVSLIHLEEHVGYLRKVIETDWSMVRASTFAVEIGKDAGEILERLNTLRAITETKEIYTAKDPADGP